MLRILFSFSLAAVDPASYSRDVASILAMNCNGCHGATPAGGLDTRTHRELVKGGSLGAAVVAGDPESSPLVQFIEGRRGATRRMPLFEPPLEPEQIVLIRRWILEGARQDADTGARHGLAIDGAEFRPGNRVEVRSRVPVPCYLRLAIRAAGGRVLHTGEVAVRQPGEWISWSIGAGPDWPAVARVELSIAYAEGEPAGAILAVGGLESTALRRER